MDWQMIIVSAIVVCAVAYMVVRVSKIVKHSDDPCCTCGCCQTGKQKKSFDKGKCPHSERKDDKNLQV